VPRAPNRSKSATTASRSWSTTGAERGLSSLVPLEIIANARLIDADETAPSPAMIRAGTLFQPTILLALALMAVIVMMILPMPAWVLDIGLAASFRPRDPDVHRHPLHPATARFLGLSDDPPCVADAAAVAERLVDQAHHRRGTHREPTRPATSSRASRCSSWAAASFWVSSSSASC
jgi:hypothetical protein